MPRVYGYTDSGQAMMKNIGKPLIHLLELPIKKGAESIVPRVSSTRQYHLTSATPTKADSILLGVTNPV